MASHAFVAPGCHRCSTDWGVEAPCDSCLRELLLFLEILLGHGVKLVGRAAPHAVHEFVELGLKVVAGELIVKAIHLSALVEFPDVIHELLVPQPLLNAILVHLKWTDLVATIEPYDLVVGQFSDPQKAIYSNISGDICRGCVYDNFAALCKAFCHDNVCCCLACSRLRLLFYGLVSDYPIEE